MFQATRRVARVRGAGPVPDDSLLCSLAIRDAQILTSAAPFAASDTPSERAMLERYFRGAGGSYSLAPQERAAALEYIRSNIKDTNLVGLPYRGTRKGRNSRHVNFAFWDPLAGYWGEPTVDGLLGRATVEFDGDRPIRLHDRYDFEPGGRGAAVEAATAYLRNSARTFCRNPAPVAIEGDLRGVR